VPAPDLTGCRKTPVLYQRTTLQLAEKLIF
jgi:hypothetical protein